MTSRITLSNTDLSVYPLCLGGNVFGWTANKEQSFKVLDAMVDLGGNFIDTADVYSEWAPGNSGGESESVIGDWMASRKNRDQVVVATKVALLSTRQGLSRSNIFSAIDDSLRRLKTDYIDLYYSHKQDETVALEETLEAFDQLVKVGKVRHLGASQHTGQRLADSLRVSKDNGWASYAVLQNQYNLVERKEFEADSAPVLEENGLTALPFWSLAMGFLTGKYQPGVAVESVRAGGVEKYQNDSGWAVVAALGEIARQNSTNESAIALAWLRSKATVAAPIASARTVEQLQQIMPLVEMDPSQVALLDRVSA